VRVPLAVIGAVEMAAPGLIHRTDDPDQQAEAGRSRAMRVAAEL